MRNHGAVWAILLAGGSGQRLRELTLDAQGRPVPKQFWRFRDDKPMLLWALERARRVASLRHIVAVVAEQHRRWWGPLLAVLPGENVLPQPENRGTAVGILHALLHLAQRDPAATAVILPSDHDVEDEGVLYRSMERAVASARECRRRVTLLGICPEGPDTDYGWILPGPRTTDGLRSVRRFIEKPSAFVATQLFEQGALWNSFISAGTAPALLELYEHAQPDMLSLYLAGLERVGSRDLSLAVLYRELPTIDFGRDLLQGAVEHLGLLAVPPCGWADLGTPSRVAAWLSRQVRPAPEARPAAV